MATRVLNDVYISWNSVDLSAWLTGIRVNYDADEVEDTAMGDDTHSFLGGLKNWSMEPIFNNDEAASAVMQTLFPDVGVTRTVVVRPDKSEGVSGTNPNYSGTGLLSGLPILDGNVGDLSKTSPRIVSAGTLSRLTS